MTKPMDVAAAKVKGFERSVEARVRGLVGVFQLLARQHGEASALLDRVREDPSKRDALWPEIRLALRSHERAELAAVYPALDQYDALKQFVKQHANEADELEAMIDRLDAISPGSDDWKAAFETLGNLVRDHVAAEENEIFPIALDEMGPEPARDLEAAYRAAQRVVQNSLTKLTH